MKTIFVATAIFASWVMMGVEIVSRNDEHLFRVMECMNSVGRERNISPQEAYIICEKRDK